MCLTVAWWSPWCYTCLRRAKSNEPPTCRCRSGHLFARVKNSEIAPTGSMVGRGGGRAWRQVGPACLLHVHLKKRALSQRNEARTPLPHVTGAVFFTRFEFISHTGVVVAEGTGSDRQGGLRSTKKPCPHPMDPVCSQVSRARTKTKTCRRCNGSKRCKPVSRLSRTTEGWATTSVDVPLPDWPRSED